MFICPIRVIRVPKIFVGTRQVQYGTFFIQKIFLPL